jgi:UDP:flavonoid glycosyltransferase YjiC (YdhE family)
MLSCLNLQVLTPRQMSFGTSFHPKDPTKVFAFVNELLDMSVPFLWSHASPFAKVPEDLAARIDNSTLAHHASWVPQRAVLAHPATMWFVSHGGWNSAQEALGLRVPM